VERFRPVIPATGKQGLWVWKHRAPLI